MKKFLPLTLAAVTLGLAAMAFVPNLAQAAPRAHRDKTRVAGSHKMQKLAAELGLTTAQKAQLKPMLAGTGQQVKAIKADTSLTAEAKQAKIKSLRKSTRQGMLAVLTPDQRQKLKAVRRQHRAAKGKAGVSGQADV